MKKHETRGRVMRLLALAVICAVVVFIGTFSALGAGESTAAAAETVVTVEYDGGDSKTYDLAYISLPDDYEGEASAGASEYLDDCEDNSISDKNYHANVETAVATMRQDVKSYATFWSLIPPVIAIVLALITKEVYSSLFIGILAGGLIYSGFKLEGTVVHTLQNGFVASVADS